MAFRVVKCRYNVKNSSIIYERSIKSEQEKKLRLGRTKRPEDYETLRYENHLLLNTNYHELSTNYIMNYFRDMQKNRIYICKFGKKIVTLHSILLQPYRYFLCVTFIFVSKASDLIAKSQKNTIKECQ